MAGYDFALKGAVIVSKLTTGCAENVSQWDLTVCHEQGSMQTGTGGPLQNGFEEHF